MTSLLSVLCLAALGGEPHPSMVAAERLRDMLQRAHDERDGARLVARKVSVESALLPAFIVQDLAHGCASQDVARSMSYTYGGADAQRCAGSVWPISVSESAPTIELGWACPAGMAWRVRATTERLCSAGPEPAVAIDWVIQSDGTSTTAIAERFEPALMPAELDFPLVPWGLSLHWDDERGRALDQSGQSHTESWVASAPILANPDDMFDTFDAMRVQQWLRRWQSPASFGGLRLEFWPGPRDIRHPPPSHSKPFDRSLLGSHSISLDHGPLRWHDPHAYTLMHHGSSHDRTEPFRPVRLIPNITGLRAIIEWIPWLADHAGAGPTDHNEGAPPLITAASVDRPSRVPYRVRIVSDEREQAIITFGRFELVPCRGATEHSQLEPPWLAVRQAIEARDPIALTALVLRAQDGLGTVQARARMGIEQAIQALDAAIDAGWSVELLRTAAPNLLERCMSRLAPSELMWLTLDATLASRGTIAVLAATRLSKHAQATADERTWASMALPSLWAWLHEPPADDSPMGARRLACDRALRHIMLGEQQALARHDGGAP
jgi:hypothetical protein